MSEPKKTRTMSTSHKEAVLDTHAHYADSQFSRGETATIFGEQDPALNYAYSDRLYESDRDAYRRCVESANNAAPCKTALWYEHMLSEYYGYRVEVAHILKGVNVATGYDYLIFGTKKIGPQEVPE